MLLRSDTFRLGLGIKTLLKFNWGLSFLLWYSFGWKGSNESENMHQDNGINVCAHKFSPGKVLGLCDTIELIQAHIMEDQLNHAMTIKQF